MVSYANYKCVTFGPIPPSQEPFQDILSSTLNNILLKTWTAMVKRKGKKGSLGLKPLIVWTIHWHFHSPKLQNLLNTCNPSSKSSILGWISFFLEHDPKNPNPWSLAFSTSILKTIPSSLDHLFPSTIPLAIKTASRIRLSLTKAPCEMNNLPKDSLDTTR